jgi:ATP-dependent DNA helicase RecQ
MQEAPRVEARVIEMSPVDEALRDYMREWRRKTAHAQGSPAFVVMHDTTLDEICRKRPQSKPDLLKITGIGERKAELYGPGILDALEHFREGARASEPPKQISRPAAATKKLLEEGQSFAEVAVIRGRQLSTIVNSVAELIESGDIEFKPVWVDASRLKEIEAACARLGTDALRPIKDAVSAEITFDDIRLVVAQYRWQQKQNQRTGT